MTNHKTTKILVLGAAGVTGRMAIARLLDLGCEVTAARFDNGSATWNLTLGDGGTLRADALVSAVGQLGRPRFPDIPGRDDFAGPSWHSARWDHSHDLTGRRVAVIGTGASAIQFVPKIAPDEVPIGHPEFPFCSEHCKTIDLGKWCTAACLISTS